MKGQDCLAEMTDGVITACERAETPDELEGHLLQAVEQLHQLRTPGDLQRGIRHLANVLAAHQFCYARTVQQWEDFLRWVMIQAQGGRHTWSLEALLAP